MIQALTGYAVSQLLCEDEPFVLLRALRQAGRVWVLRAARYQNGGGERLEHEYALRAELDPAWTADLL